MSGAFALLVVLAFSDILFPLGLYLWGVPLLSAAVVFLSSGTLNIGQVFVFCFLGSYSGAVVNFVFADFILRVFPKLENKIDTQKLVRLKKGLDSKSILLAALVAMRFTAISRPLSGAMCRVAQVSLVTFLKLECVAALLWVFVWSMVAFIFPELFDVSKITGWVEEWIGEILN